MAPRIEIKISGYSMPRICHNAKLFSLYIIDKGEHMGSPLSMTAIHGVNPVKPENTPDGFDLGQFDEHLGVLGEHIDSPLSAVIQWFKTMTTNEYIRNVKTNGWPPFDRRLWQRNYYEHIVRSDKVWFRIQNYIINNPIAWQRDHQYQKIV